MPACTQRPDEEEVPQDAEHLPEAGPASAEELQQVLPPPRGSNARRARGEDPGVPPDFFAEACPCAQQQVAELRAQVLAERDARLRAESYAAGVDHGWRQAVSLLAPSVLGLRPATTPEVMPSPPSSSGHVTQPVAAVTQSQRDNQRDTAPVSVTSAVEGGGGEENPKRIPKPATLRQQLKRQRDRQKASVTGSVTPPLPPPSASKTRGALVAVTQDARAVRDVREAAREYRKPDALPADIRALREGWNAMALAHGFPAWGERTSRRMAEDALAALRRRPLEEWLRVFTLVPRSPACRGELSNRLRANVVWVLTWTRAGLEVAEQLLSGAWSLDPERPEAPPHEEPGAAVCLEDVPMGTEAARAWARVLAALRADGKHRACEGLECFRAVALDDAGLEVAAPDQFSLDWMQDTCRGLVNVYAHRTGLTGLRFVVQEQEEEYSPPVAPAEPVETLPFEPPPSIAPAAESLPDGVERVFLAARGCSYTWQPYRDDPAARRLLALAGTGGVSEVLRRWGHGVEARYRQRCDTLADLVRRWEANATPEYRPDTSQPAESRRRADVDVGRGEAPQALDLPDTPAGRAWAQVLERMREQGGGAAYIARQAQGRFRAVELAGGCLVLEAPDKYALTLLDEDYGGAALNAAARTLDLELRATIAGQPAGAHAGGLQ